jgi:hypothetical protein
MQPRPMPGISSSREQASLVDPVAWRLGVQALLKRALLLASKVYSLRRYVSSPRPQAKGPPGIIPRSCQYTIRCAWASDPRAKS